MPEIHDDTDADTGAERGPQDKAREGLEHLQAAARELIHAARAMLDVAEDVVNDPEAVASAAATVGGIGDLIRHGVGASTRPSQPPGDGEAGPPSDGSDGPDGGPSGVERITVL